MVGAPLPGDSPSLLKNLMGRLTLDDVSTPSTSEGWDPLATSTVAASLLIDGTMKKTGQTKEQALADLAEKATQQYIIEDTEAAVVKVCLHSPSFVSGFFAGFHNV